MLITQLYIRSDHVRDFANPYKLQAYWQFPVASRQRQARPSSIGVVDETQAEPFSVFGLKVHRGSRFSNSCPKLITMCALEQQGFASRRADRAAQINKSPSSMLHGKRERLYDMYIYIIYAGVSVCKCAITARSDTISQSFHFLEDRDWRSQSMLGAALN